MQVIVTHDVADFDAIASSVAASRLYPGAVMVRRRLTGPSERAFLALHKDRFESVPYHKIDMHAVRRLVVVDVRSRQRLEDFQPLLDRVDAGDDTLDVHVWDHHAASSDDLHGDFEVVEPVGAVTTLLLEEMQRRGLTVDPVEATLYALGIHADTGSLTYANSTDRDAEAVAWLLRAGASLSMLNRYLRPALSEAQRDLLARLLGSVQTVRVGAVDVEIATVSLPKSMGGLSVVTTQACQLGDAAAFFALFDIGARGVQLVGRSQRSVIDVGALMERLGGGGHREAGSAVFHRADADEVRARLVRELQADPPRPRFVHELMSSPVRTVRHDETLRALQESLSARGHTGAPVVRDGKMIGVLSRRDIERAADAGDLRLPASGWMTAPPRTIDKDASLDEALAVMTKHDVGRLPVLDGERLVGIVCRSDVLRVLYGEPERSRG